MIMRYQRISPDSLPLSNGRRTNSTSNSNWKIIKENEERGEINGSLTVKSSSTFEGKSVSRFRSPSRSSHIGNGNSNGTMVVVSTEVPNSPPTTATTRNHHQNLESYGVVVGGSGGGVDTFLQWGHRKRSRCSRGMALTDETSSSSTSTLQFQPLGTKLQRRSSSSSSSPNANLMPPPSSNGIASRGPIIKPQNKNLPSTASPVRRNLEERSVVGGSGGGLNKSPAADGGGSSSRGVVSCSSSSSSRSRIAARKTSVVDKKNLSLVVSSSSSFATREEKINGGCSLQQKRKNQEEAVNSDAMMSTIINATIPNHNNNSSSVCPPQQQQQGGVGGECSSSMNDNHHANENNGVGGRTGKLVVGGGGGEVKEWPRICIPLSRKEKEEDFLAMKGTKLPHRPKKRPKVVERTLQYCFPGLWLSDLPKGRYEVREKKCARTTKPKKRGLKGMESMESDSE